MKIGIINAGNIGGRLARAWANVGHEIMLSKDGEIHKLDPVLADIDAAGHGGSVSTGSLREAAAFGDVVLFSVYWPRLDAVLAEIGDALDGKTVIETMNPLGVTEDFVHYHDTEFMTENSTTEQLQGKLPNAQVVKAFSTMAAPVLEAAAWSNRGDRQSVFYVGGDADAKTVTRTLIEDAGFRPVNAGPISAARQLEQIGVLLHHVAHNEFHGDEDLIRIGFRMVEADPGPIARARVA